MDEVFSSLLKEKQLLFEYHLIDEGTEIQVIADDVDNPPKKVQINNVMGDLYEDPGPR